MGGHTIRYALALALFSVAACSGDTTEDPGPITMDPDNDDEAAGGALPTEFGGDRPVTLQVPPGYDASEPTPLLLVVHGYGATGEIQTAYTGLGNLVAEHGYLLLAPDGLVDPGDRQYWNATPACCDFWKSGVDDVAYPTGLIEEVDEHYNVDRDRVVVFGHSNGGFMAYRLACDRPDVFRSIVSLAGAVNIDPSVCTPSEAVNVLQIHGSADDLILFDGGNTCGTAECDFPSAMEAVNRWSGLNGCTAAMEETSEKRDLDSALAGEETLVSRAGGCPEGGAVELWRIEGGGHVPQLGATFASSLADWYATR
jgi:polyhydroxybutyrate depolymerase